MTDNELAEGMACCAKTGDCRKCEFAKHDTCFVTCEKEIFAFIERKDAEVERLQAMKDAALDTIHKLGEDYAKALEENNRKDAEIKALKKANESFSCIGMLYSEIKSEARKEFAERLESLCSHSVFEKGGQLSSDRAILVSDMRKLLAEMEERE